MCAGDAAVVNASLYLVLGARKSEDEGGRARGTSTRPAHTALELAALAALYDDGLHCLRPFTPRDARSCIPAGACVWVWIGLSVNGARKDRLCLGLCASAVPPVRVFDALDNAHVCVCAHLEAGLEVEE